MIVKLLTGVSMLKRRLQRLVRVHTCQNATLLVITCTGSFHTKSQVSCVRTLEIKSTIQDICAQRNDSWSQSVMARTVYSQYLPASDTVYHRQCSTNLRIIVR